MSFCTRDLSNRGFWYPQGWVGGGPGTIPPWTPGTTVFVEHIYRRALCFSNDSHRFFLEGTSAVSGALKILVWFSSGTTKGISETRDLKGRDQILSSCTSGQRCTLHGRGFWLFRNVLQHFHFRSNFSPGFWCFEDISSTLRVKRTRGDNHHMN